jgi:hypothetical protein
MQPNKGLDLGVYAQSLGNSGCELPWSNPLLYIVYYMSPPRQCWDALYGRGTRAYRGNSVIALDTVLAFKEHRSILNFLYNY